MDVQHFTAICLHAPQWHTCIAGVTTNYRGITNRILKLSLTGGSIVYISAISATDSFHPTVSADTRTSCVAVQLFFNPLFACMQGIADGDYVHVEMPAVDTVPRCCSATLQVDDMEQWNLMQLHGTKIEWILPDHIRVIQSGQRFCVQLHASICISLHVVSIQPSQAEFVQLTRGTELVILPPTSDISSVSSPVAESPSKIATESDSWLSTLMPWLDSVSGAEVATATAKLPECDQINSSNAGYSATQKTTKPRTNPEVPAPPNTNIVAEEHFGDFSSTIHPTAASQFMRLFRLAIDLPKLDSPFTTLICGHKGSGKSFFAEHLLHLIRQDFPTNVTVDVQQISCRKISGRRPEFFVSTIEAALESVCRHEIGVILLDDLNYVCPSHSSSDRSNDADAFSAKLPNKQQNPDDANQTEIHSERIAHVLLELRRAIQTRVCQTPRLRNIVILATSTAEADIHPLLQSTLRSSRHYFDSVLTLSAPDAEACVRIVVDNLRYRFSSISNCGIGPECLQNTIGECMKADQTVGFSVAEWSRLCDMICHRLILQHSAFAADDFTAVFMQCSDALQAEKQASSIGIYSSSSLNKKRKKLCWSDLENTVAPDFLERLQDIFDLPARYPTLVACCPIALPRGVLLYGVPGSGKTFLCRIVAEACRFRRVFFVKGPELLTKYIGASEARVRQLFADARQCRPSLIVFDEFDALAPRRGHDSTGVTDRVVNQLLAELDGVNESRGISVIATSSRPDLIDDALLRPGRIDVSLRCDLPTAAQRHVILVKFYSGLLFAPTGDADGEANQQVVDLLQVADRCAGFTAADLRAVVYDAQMNAIREHNGTNSAKSFTSSKAPLLTELHFERALKIAKSALSTKDTARFEMSFARFSTRRQPSAVNSIEQSVKTDVGDQENIGSLTLKTMLV